MSGRDAALAAVLEAAPDAIIAVDADGRVVLANRRAERLFGQPMSQLVGADVRTLVPGGLPASADADVPVVTDARRAAGGTVPVEVTVGEAGTLRCAVLRDISDRLTAEAEQRRLRAVAERDRVDAQLQRAQRWESLGQLAGGVAHDFNNIVGVILSYAEFVVEQAATGGDVGAIAADAQQVVRAAHRASQLTQQLLSFARRDVARIEPIDLNVLVRDVRALLRRSVGEHIAVRALLSDPLPAVLADGEQLRQALMNLAVNARDAMPGGGTLTLRTDLPADDQGRWPPGRYARLRVTDTGSGMPREVIERAFEPFYSTKPRGEGAGLGLATVFGAVTQAGGEVSIDSALGAGTTITMLLPLAQSQESPPAGPSPSSAPSAETILFVEDDEALRDVAARTLRSAGYRVLLAADGAAALELALAHAGPIQLLVSDVVLPGIQGRELAGRLALTRPGTRVLYVSGYAPPVLASRGTLAADVTLLTKPFSRDELLSAVRRRLDER
ncbi:ATP-binding protein [Pilimelia columellifera]|uniref:histidine kinase n=1 Tax=Pilimelia columellifera subsp. columellifera TaxID=706583 RepID=A0ABP6AWI8_9ACTN